ncbi:MAG: hypothetical protein Q4G14_05700 [Paracoccus sp. (in: a-proteobacteria)]|uniref:hypothetical protein n=1 Tax=Paracoccus sp. TaxID=267 RepID=UPI0026DEE849|nr:hypothetical protein [Paracoccus sp. (in: a-proteobacteria)]MDO5612723.1 hypothetical protein [Paracoccus sp. (in: a-proteobacteria)]
MMNRTRIVRWLRVLLPLLALAILSTLFLLGRKPGVAPNIPYAQVDAEDMARDPRITAPHYAGVTPDGAQISLSAAEASTDPADGRLRSLQMDWRAPGDGGLTASLAAPLAETSPDSVHLSGGVQMQTSSGWRLTAPDITAMMTDDRISASEGVAATAPFGRIEAGAMDLVPDGAGAGHVLNFTGGVRLLYQP